MGEKKTTPITINDVEYILEDMTDEQQTIVNHIQDLGRKIDSTKFNLDQLQVGQNAFVNMLTLQLEAEDVAENLEGEVEPEEVH
jgi:hypothetical protein